MTHYQFGTVQTVPATFTVSILDSTGTALANQPTNLAAALGLAANEAEDVLFWTSPEAGNYYIHI